MGQSLILASGSSARRNMLENAAVSFGIEIARIDEEALRDSLLAQEARPRDVADALAEMKACKVSEKHPEALVIGCDQTLDLEGKLLSKPASPEIAAQQIRQMRGKPHDLFSAAVICEAGRPIWRHVSRVRMRVRPLSDGYIDSYVARNWPGIGEAVGGYKLEEEGVRLFSRVEGDYFAVLGMPLSEVLSYLIMRGDLEQ